MGSMKRSRFLGGAVTVAFCVAGGCLAQVNEETKDVVPEIAALRGNAVEELRQEEFFFPKDPLGKLKGIIALAKAPVTALTATAAAAAIKPKATKSKPKAALKGKSKSPPLTYRQLCPFIAAYEVFPGGGDRNSDILRSIAVQSSTFPRPETAEFACVDNEKCSCGWNVGPTVSSRDSECWMSDSTIEGGQCAFAYVINPLNEFWLYHESPPSDDSALGSNGDYDYPFNPTGAKLEYNVTQSPSDQDKLNAFAMGRMKVTVVPGPNEAPISFDLIPDVSAFFDERVIPSWTGDGYECDPEAFEGTRKASALCNVRFVSEDPIGTGCKQNGVTDCVIFFATTTPGGKVSHRWIYRQDNDDQSLFSYSDKRTPYVNIWYASDALTAPVVQTVEFVEEECESCTTWSKK